LSRQRCLDRRRLLRRKINFPQRRRTTSCPESFSCHAFLIVATGAPVAVDKRPIIPGVKGTVRPSRIATISPGGDDDRLTSVLI
jgi:hypothetical protein